MKNFTLSGAFSFYPFLFRLLQYVREHPDYLRPDTRIESVFGSVNNLIWSGGRVEKLDLLPLEAIRQLVTVYNSQGIGVNLTLTNTLLDESHLDDPESNKIVRLLNENPLNGAITASELLRDYLATTYPNLNLILSCTHCVNDVAYHHAREDRYDLLVLPPDVVKDPGKVREFGTLAKYEILVNEKCVPDCPIRRAHYEAISDTIMHDTSMESFVCSRVAHPADSGKLVLTPSEVDAYAAMGIEHFKLVGRVEAVGYFQIAYEYIHYLLTDDAFMEATMRIVTPFITESLRPAQ